jgi:dienelactone hydrolase
MKFRSLFLALALIGSCSSAALPAGHDETSFSFLTTNSTSSVATVKYDWMDQKRDRKVPVKIYYPRTGSGPFPVIIFSHGLGGSRDGYEYLGRYWAGHGFVSVHLQHLGSDSSVFTDVPPAERMAAMRKSVANLENARNRPLDVAFAIDEITRLNREDPVLKDRLDLNHIGMAGHSFGAFTTQASIGETFVTPEGEKFSAGDARIKAAISMSPYAPPKKDQYDMAFSNINVPCFHMTGTRDDSPVGDTMAADRRVAFDHTKGADQFLVIFKHGDHMIFSGRLRRQAADRDPFFQKLICQSSTAFWDAYLRDDAHAKAWLTGKGFETVLGGNGTFEKKAKLQ